MEDDDINLSDIPELTEEDFKRGKRGKQFFAERGLKFDPTGPHEVIVYHEDGTTSTYTIPANEQRTVLLDPDVSEHFPDSESVNRTLRALIALIPHKE